MKKAKLSFLIFLGVSVLTVQAQTVVNYTAAGTFSWTAPCDVTSIQVECWGGGAGGGYGGTANRNGGGGGGGGAYIKNSSVVVVPGTTYSITVAALAAGGTVFFPNGGSGNSSFGVFGAVTVTAIGGTGGMAYANGGAGGAGGSGGTYNGGNGANGTAALSGGGGEGASSTLSGINGVGTVGGTGTSGGDGGDGNANPSVVGLAGSTVGGGGGGGTRNRNGGAGAIGKVALTFTTGFPFSYCVPTFTSGTEPISNVTFAGINNTTTSVIGGSAYEKFCDMGSVVVGSVANSISVAGNTDGNYTDYIRVYIDWNQNGDFLDANEVYDIGTISDCDGCSVSNNIAVPCTALTGVTTIRVMKRFGGYSSTACETGAGWGQAEDYPLTVTAEPGAVTPTAQPTALVVNAVSGAQIDGNFTASSPVAENYLVIRTTTSAAPSPTPVDGTSYVVGAAHGATGTIVSVGTSTSFSAAGLTPNTTYWFWVYSYNGSCDTKYLTSSPLTGSQTTMNAINWIGIGTSGGTGGTDFNTAANWSPAQVPGPADNAVITTTQNGTITLSASATIGSLTLLNDATAARTLVLDVTTYVLTVNGDLMANIKATAGSGSFLSLRIGNSPGGIIVNGKSTLGNNSNVDSYLDVTGSGAGATTGSYTMKGDSYFGSTYYPFAGSIGTFIWDAVSSQSIFTNSVYLVPFNGSCQIGGSNSPTVTLSSSTLSSLWVAGADIGTNLTVKNGSTLDLGSKYWNKETSGGVFTLEAGSTLNLRGTSGGQTGSNFPLNFTTSAPVINATSTVEYSSTGNQTIYDVAAPGYGNLTLSSNAVKSATTGLEVQGNLTINSTATFDGGTSITHTVAKDWINNGSFTYSVGNTISLTGTANQSISGVSSSSFDNLTNSNTSTGLTLGQNILVAGNLSMSGASANILLNGYTIDLSTAGTILLEGNSNRIYGATGKITTTRNLNNISSLDVGGMGCLLTTTQDMGSTTISRGHAPQSGTGLPNATISRYYDIVPTNNTGLNATMRFHYFDNELGGIGGNEASFELYRSTDGGVNWTERFGAVNTAANYVNLPGIAAFSIWTVSFPSIVALPIELITFEAKKKDRHNLVSWVTMTEFNNDFFTLERSEDGKNFEIINVVDGAGSSSAVLSYSFEDHDFVSEINYYRLKQTDYDGQNRYSDMVSVDNRVVHKKIARIVNLYGQEVDEQYKGAVIIVYHDNTILKTIQNIK
jgi:hypothetical protein